MNNQKQPARMNNQKQPAGMNTQTPDYSDGAEEMVSAPRLQLSAEEQALIQPAIDRFAGQQLDRILGSLDRLGEAALSRRRALQIATGIAAGTIASTKLSPLRRLLGIDSAGAATNDGIVVLVYLDGGNDGLNTLVPLTNSLYPTLRRTLAINGATTLPINADYGLNPALPYVHSQYTSGRVAVIRGLGYGPANLSHFTSIDHWHNGFGAANGPLQAVPHSGWIGRYTDTLGTANPFAAATMGTQVPLSMRGLSSSALLIPTQEETLLGSRPNELNDAWLVEALRQIDVGGTGAGPLANLLASTGVRATRAASGATSTWNNAVGTAIGRQLHMAANLINANLGTRVITVALDGFDTHAGQRPIHQRLLSELDTALQGFFQRVAPEHARKVTVVTYSEFGRRARANDSDGTDHGTSSIAMVMGANVSGGLYGDDPGLSNLDANGNPQVVHDFRRLYASLLQGWLLADPAQILGATHNPFPLFAAAPGIVPVPTTIGASTTTVAGSTSTTIATPTTVAGATTSITVGATVPPPTTVPVPAPVSITVLGVPLSLRATRFVVERPAGIINDWLAVAAVGSPPETYISRKMLPGKGANSGSSAVIALAMPPAGSYEIRYFSSTPALLAAVTIPVSD